MELTFDGAVLRGGTDARERFYDSRGYGQPRDGALELAPVEAAHLLFRGDLDAVLDRRPDRERNAETDSRAGDRLDFHEFLASNAVSEVSFFVYKELRDRGFYLSPAHLAPSTGTVRGQTGRGQPSSDRADDREFVVYPRGHGPWDDDIAYRVRAVSEREGVSAHSLTELAQTGDKSGTGVLAVVDEESEVTYLELGEPPIDGSTDHDLPSFEGLFLSDRVLVTEPPSGLYHRAFYGQQLDRDERPIQLSLVEAAYLTDCGLLTIESDETGHGNSDGAGHGNSDGTSTPSATGEHDDGTGYRAVLERGRQVEGERFDRRLRVYRTLRRADIVPKTGFKFGADFRTYADVASVDDLGHSELLVRVLPGTHTFAPRDLALDVRLAHGVRKQMVFALVNDDIDWLSVERVTP